MSSPLTQQALDQLFVTAHTHSQWLVQTIPTETLYQLYELLKLAPTSAKCSAGRFVLCNH